MVWEDVHWSDPTTRESSTSSSIGSDAAGAGDPHLPAGVHAALDRASPCDDAHAQSPAAPTARRDDRASTGGKALPKEIADQIIDRTDGVPLFIEELTKTVVESGIVTEAGDHYALAGPVAPLAIPTSLHASLLARLDRLAPTREVAQIGAALGRSFSYELISAVARDAAAEAGRALEQLCKRRIDLPAREPPDAEYTFKHALVQDAAYSTLLRSRRQQYMPGSPRPWRTISRDRGGAASAPGAALARAGLNEKRHRLLAQGRPAGQLRVCDAIEAVANWQRDWV